MAIQERKKTDYPGVYFIVGTSASGKPENIFYIRYRRNGKLVEEKVGRQYRDNMTPSKAAKVRVSRIEGDSLSNRERREQEKAPLPETWTFDRLWAEYKVSKKIKGEKVDDNRYKNHIQPIWGDREPKNITVFEIENLKQRILIDHQPQTLKNIITLLLRIINFGLKKQLCEGLSFKIEMPKVNNIKTEDLSPEQLKRLLSVLSDDPNRQAANIMLLVLYTGMRRGEIFNLKWVDVDFDKGFIHIKSPKGGYDQTIPLNSSARELLQNVARTNSEYIFAGRNNMRKTQNHKSLTRIKKRAGLPKDFRPLHGLRHVYASMLASSGQVDMYTLQKLLTHKSPQMTQRYAHLRDGTLRNASNLASDIIKKAIEEK